MTITDILHKFHTPVWGHLPLPLPLAAPLHVI